MVYLVVQFNFLTDVSALSFSCPDVLPRAAAIQGTAMNAFSSTEKLVETQQYDSESDFPDDPMYLIKSERRSLFRGLEYKHIIIHILLLVVYTAIVWVICLVISKDSSQQHREQVYSSYEDKDSIFKSADHHSSCSIGSQMGD